MPGIGHSSTGEIPQLFFVLLIIYGVVNIAAGFYRWPYFLDDPRLTSFFRSFFIFSTEGNNDCAAALSILAGVVTIITGVQGLVFL